MDTWKTDLYVSAKSSAPLFRSLECSLRKCNVRALLGPQRTGDNYHKIVLLPLCKENVKFKEAEGILKRYLGYQLVTDSIPPALANRTRRTTKLLMTKQSEPKTRRSRRGTEGVKSIQVTCVNQFALRHSASSTNTKEVSEAREVICINQPLALRHLPCTKDVSSRIEISEAQEAAIDDDDDIEIIDDTYNNKKVRNCDVDFNKSIDLTNDTNTDKHVTVNKVQVHSEDNGTSNAQLMSHELSVINIEDDDDEDDIVMMPIDNTNKEIGRNIVNQNANNIVADNFDCEIITDKTSKDEDEVVEVPIKDDSIELIELSGNDDNESIVTLSDYQLTPIVFEKPLKKKSRRTIQKRRRRVPNKKLMETLRNTNKSDLIKLGYVVINGDTPINKDQRNETRKQTLRSKRSKFIQAINADIPSNNILRENRNLIMPKNLNNLVMLESVKDNTVLNKNSNLSTTVNNNQRALEIARVDKRTQIASTCDLWKRPAHFALNKKNEHDANNALVPLMDISFNKKNEHDANNALVPLMAVSFKTVTDTARNVVNLCDDRVGANVFVPEQNEKGCRGLRPIVIDASNIAFSHGRNVEFSFKGIQICVDYFKTRGHNVYAILPNFRKGHIKDQILDKWEKDGTLVFTPSRRINGKLVVSHDDRFIIQCAAAMEGVIVSKDNYRDFIGKNALWDETILKRLLMFTWVGDLLMFPQDPLGPRGPTLDAFLRFPKSK